MELLITLFYILFVFSAIVLIVVILLQEGKGGGLTDALGTAGQQTFGVATQGIQRFTGIAAGVFLVSALGIHVMNRLSSGSTVVENPGQEGPAVPGGASGGGDAGGGGGESGN
jgi:preprotein translocase subunit SecG